MISPLEIMKGNLLMHEGKIEVVKGISEYIIFEKKKEWIGGSMVNGIPLTHDWLERLGFNRRPDFINVMDNGKMTIKEHEDGKFLFVASRFPVEYVHQLQNLHFAITGEHIKVPKQKP